MKTGTNINYFLLKGKMWKQYTELMSQVVKHVKGLRFYM